MILRFIDAIGNLVIRLFKLPWLVANALTGKRMHLNLAAYTCLPYRAASFKHLPKAPGLYIVRKGKTVLYVGKSRNLYQRWNAEGSREHHRKAQLFELKATNLCFLVLPASDIHKFEKSAILKLRPALNGTRKPRRK